MTNTSSSLWREIPERYNLMGSKCETCGTSFFPERSICPKCRRRGKIVLQPMPHEGTIESFTEIHSPPRGYENEAPYFLAIVRLVNGAKVLSQIVDSDRQRIKLGAKATMRFRKLLEAGEEGTIAYGFKFKIIQ